MKFYNFKVADWETDSLWENGKNNMLINQLNSEIFFSMKGIVEVYITVKKTTILLAVFCTKRFLRDFFQFTEHSLPSRSIAFYTF